jgi:hypothetical protein
MRVRPQQDKRTRRLLNWKNSPTRCCDVDWLIALIPRYRSHMFSVDGGRCWGRLEECNLRGSVRAIDKVLGKRIDKVLLLHGMPEEYMPRVRLWELQISLLSFSVSLAIFCTLGVYLAVSFPWNPSLSPKRQVVLCMFILVPTFLFFQECSLYLFECVVCVCVF